MNRLLLLWLLSGLSLGVWTCTADELPAPMVRDCTQQTPTYVTDIQPIIEQSCAYSGCHLDAAPGNYSTYDGLLPSLRNGKFRTLVILQREDPVRGMPPASVPEGRPDMLTPTQLEQVECWLDAGFPEN